MNFMKKLQDTLEDRMKLTENGAAGFETSKSALVDLNFAVASLRNEQEQEITTRFMKAFLEDRVLAMKWLFFLRDVRGGLGERRTFRIILRYLAYHYTDMICALTEILSEYGRYDDLLVLIDTPAEERVLSCIAAQLKEDAANRENGQSISLCAKWMPSINTSSAESRSLAKKLQKSLGFTAKQYRKLLAQLREYLKITEVYMSANRWEDIDYSAVASKANVLYRNAFMRHDVERREAFLEKAEQGEAVMHAEVLMPHDIVAQYAPDVSDDKIKIDVIDTSLEILWNNLPDTVNEAENVLCVVDGSGSMTVPIGRTGITALHISNALGIYFAERLKGDYHNKFITFSSRPEYVDLSKCQSLQEKLQLAFLCDDCSNTNLEATFDLILETAVKGRLKQEELPGTVLIISDMEFDAAVPEVLTGFDYSTWDALTKAMRKGKVFEEDNRDTLFETIRKKYQKHGYILPRLVFWNVNGRTGVIPIRENEQGVALVSGFSTHICQMVLSQELSPYKALVKVLNNPRYKVIEKYVTVQ